VGNHAQHFEMHVPVEHVVVDLVEHGRQQVEHVVKLGRDKLKVQVVQERGVVAKAVQKIENPHGCEHVVPLGDTRVQPQRQNLELFNRERLHGLIIIKIYNICVQFFR
jgi:hypothetical protein